MLQMYGCSWTTIICSMIKEPGMFVYQSLLLIHLEFCWHTSSFNSVFTAYCKEQLTPVTVEGSEEPVSIWLKIPLNYCNTFCPDRPWSRNSMKSEGVVSLILDPNSPSNMTVSEMKPLPSHHGQRIPHPSLGGLLSTNIGLCMQRNIIQMEFLLSLGLLIMDWLLWLPVLKDISFNPRTFGEFSFQFMFWMKI